MIKKKPMLPMITVEQVMPTNEDDKKCAPNITFDNGSCMTIKQLINIATSYNKNCSISNSGTPIILDDGYEIMDESGYKRYLLFEIKKRFKGDQKSWLTSNYIKYMNSEDKNELTKNVFRPGGPQGKFDWLSTFDIKYSLDQYENKYPDFKFLGAVPIDFDEMTNLNIKSLKFNDLEKMGKHRIGVVFNLDEHYKSGSHWVSLFSDLKKGQIYFSDSYGIKPEKRIVKFIKRLEEYIVSKGIKSTIGYNKMRHQRGDSECGVYSINFILRLLKGKSFESLTTKRIPDSKVNQCRLVYFNKK